MVLAGQKARPLGLAYWLVTDTGPKWMMPATVKRRTSWLTQLEDWARVRQQLEQWVATLVTHIRQGTFPLRPREENCTETCDYSQVCRISQARVFVENRTWQLSLPVVTGSRGEEHEPAARED